MTTTAIDEVAIAPEREWPEELRAGNSTYNTDQIAGSFEFIGTWAKDDHQRRGELTGAVKFLADATNAIGCAADAKAMMPSKKSERIPEFSAIEEHLADAVLRILAWGSQNGYDVGAAVISKGLYNLDQEPAAD